MVPCATLLWPSCLPASLLETTPPLEAGRDHATTHRPSSEIIQNLPAQLTAAAQPLKLSHLRQNYTQHHCC